MNTEKAYEIAREQYAALGVDTEQAMKNMEQVKISIHVWLSLIHISEPTRP